MRELLLVFFSLLSYLGKSQTAYTGLVGKYPIQLVTHIYSDGDARAIYAYDQHDTPIVINGRRTGNKLVLYEQDSKNEIQATLTFMDFDVKKPTLTGVWTDKQQTKKLSITLHRTFDLEDTGEWPVREIIQRVSTATHYFKLLVSQAEHGPRVSGVKIHEKKTDRLIQTIPLDCQLWGLENIATGDFNFDGLEDFSVFESSYAGPNTSSIYILRLPGSEKYMVSDFSGTSLEFDPDSKTIHEHNQCCAGTSHINATYKVVNNKMVLIEKRCMKYDDKKEDFVEVKCD
jgi:hypothetical protein